MTSEKQSWRKRAGKTLARHKKPKQSIVSSLPPTELQELFGVRPKPLKKKRVRALGHSFACATRGVLRALKTERNLRIHVVTVGYVTYFGVLAQFDALSWAMAIACFAMVISAELANTAIEYLCNKTASGFDQFIRDAKDAAAAGVLVCAVASIAIGVLLCIHGQTYLAFWQSFTQSMLHPICVVVSIPCALWWIMKL